MSIEELVLEIRNGNKYAKNELWEQIKGLVYTYVNKYALYAREHLSEPDELTNIAWFGVERAIIDYDPDKKYKFAQYLKYHIRNVIHEFFGFRGKKHVDTIYLSTPVGNEDEELFLIDTIRDEAAQDDFDNVERHIIGDFVNSQVEKMKPDTKKIIHVLFYRNMDIKRAAKALNIPIQEVKNLKQRAIRELRNNRQIERYRQEVAYHRRGYKSFNTTWTSDVESAVIGIEHKKARLNQDCSN